MGALGEALELMATSRSRWRSARLELRQEVDWCRCRLAIEQSQPAFLPKRTSPPGDPWTSRDDRSIVTAATMWAAAPDRYRVETQRIEPAPGSGDDSIDDVGDGTSLHVIDGDRSMNRDGHGMYRTADLRSSFPGPPTRDEWSVVLDPRVLAEGHEVESLGHGEVAGRPTIKVRLAAPDRASPRMGMGSGRIVVYLGWSGDESIVDLDAATGIALRIETRLDGVPMRTTEATMVELDADLDDALFSAQPPDGAQVEPMSQMAEPLDAVAASVSFTVLQPPDMTCSGFASKAQGSRPTTIHVHVMPDFARLQTQMRGPMPTLHLVESGSPTGIADPAEWEPVELADGPGRIWQAPDAGEVHVVVVRRGTHVWLRGLHDREATVAAAGSLVTVTPRS